MSEIFANDPFLKNPPSIHDMTREEKMIAGYKKLNRYYEVFKGEITIDNIAFLVEINGGNVC